MGDHFNMAFVDYSRNVSTEHRSILGSYRKNFGHQEKNQAYSILVSLRELYPDHLVQRIDARGCDLIAFAEAGHAKAQLLDTADAERKYVPPPPLHGFRPETVDDDDEDSDDEDDKKGPSTLTEPKEDDSYGDRLVDKVHFGPYSYQWQDKFFLVYNFLFEKPYSPKRHKYYIITPRSAGVSPDGLHSIPTDDLIRAVGRWQMRVHDEIMVFDDGCWQGNRALWKSVQGAKWDDVILDPHTKNSLISDVHDFFSGRALYQEFLVPWKRGLILYGVPGNGKTCSIKALMSTLYHASPATNGQPIPSLYVKSLQNCNGPQYAIRSIFEKARSFAPCMLVFEDLDSLVTAKVRSYFLNEVDGLESNDGILMIGSTNHLTALDPAIANRPSRFDRKYHFALPARAERAAYARYWRAKLEGNPKIAFPDTIADLVAGWTDTFSFAYLKELFISALLAVARGAQPGSETVAEAEAGFETPGSAASIEGDYAAALSEGAAAWSGEEGGEKDGEKKKEKKQQAAKGSGKKAVVIPEMMVPEELKDNALIHALKQQVVVLLREMDSSDKAASKKKSKKRAREDDSDAEDSDDGSEDGENDCRCC
jgi:transitional endoplasmic reticulum ATPase